MAVLSDKALAEVRSATEKELCAIWNLLQWGGLAVSDEASRAHDAAAREAVSDEMYRRQGFRPTPGQRVTTIPWVA